MSRATAARGEEWAQAVPREAAARAQMLHEDALAILADFDERADALRCISHYIIARGH